ncbi:MAG: hypothetical protein WCF25_03510 [Acidimicrobiales bacterium]
MADAPGEIVMAEFTTDVEQARMKAVGLQRWFRKRLSFELTRLLVGLIVLGGLISTATSHVLVPGAVCLSVFVVIAAVISLRTLVILGELRREPAKAVARVTKWRKVKRAGFTPVGQ